MATSNQLRKSKKQHKPKNIESKRSDKAIYLAMQKCINYLERRFKKELSGYKLVFREKLTYKEMIDHIKRQELRYEFDDVFPGRSIKPDGGVIWLEKDDGPSRLVLVSEVKKQGTNVERLSEGLPKQAQGNAIERLGKNLIGIKAMMNHEQITPFVCFGWGCDFNDKYTDDFVMAKVSMMNEFYKLNKLYVYKRDGDSHKNRYSPVSMFFRTKEWTEKEMYEILKEIGEDAIRYYLH